MTVKELESALLTLPFAEKMQILQVLLRDFANTWTGVDQAAAMGLDVQDYTEVIARLVANEPPAEVFEALADQLADDFLVLVGTPPTLSEYAVSRAGIYEEHP